MQSLKCRLAAVLVGALASLALVGGVRAQESTAVKFVRDWKLQGVHAWYSLAQDLGG